MEQVGVPWNDFWKDHFSYEAKQRDDGKWTSRIDPAAIYEQVAVINCLATTINTQRQPPQTVTDRIYAPTLIVRAALGLLGPDRGLGPFLTAPLSTSHTPGR